MGFGLEKRSRGRKLRKFPTTFVLYGLGDLLVLEPSAAGSGGGDEDDDGG